MKCDNYRIEIKPRDLKTGVINFEIIGCSSLKFRCLSDQFFSGSQWLLTLKKERIYYARNQALLFQEKLNICHTKQEPPYFSHIKNTIKNAVNIIIKEQECARKMGNLKSVSSNTE